MAQGTIFDFLQLATENDDLRTDIIALAAKHSFTFTPTELDDEELDDVAGGILAGRPTGLVLDTSKLGTQIGTLSRITKVFGKEWCPDDE